MDFMKVGTNGSPRLRPMADSAPAKITWNEASRKVGCTMQRSVEACDVCSDLKVSGAMEKPGPLSTLPESNMKSSPYCSPIE